MMRVLVMLLSLLWAIPAFALPADPLASQKTKDVLAYLESLPNRSDKRLISGQWGDWNGFGASALSTIDNIQTITGQKPGFIEFPAWKTGGTPSQFNLTTSVIQNAIAYWNAGGLIGISAHWPDPQTGGDWNGKTISGSFADIYTDNGNAKNLQMKANLDQLAAGLQFFEDANVPIILRPFLEMSSGFFWWGASGSNAEYNALWQYVFNYLTTTKGLHNILWSYSMFKFNATPWVSARYPGDAYVDIIGEDAYSMASLPGKTFNYDALVAIGKPYALTEYGLQSVGTGAAEDILAGITRIKNNMPRTVYVSAWNENWRLDFQTNLSAALNDSWIQNRPVPLTVVAPPPLTATVRVTTLSTDNVGVTIYNVRRCQGAPCNPVTAGSAVGSITPPATTLVDATVLQSQSYSYAANACDAAGNCSPYSAAVNFGAVSTVRQTLATDTFDRANNADLGANWDAAYTGRTTAQIVSNRMRSSSTTLTAMETYNAITTPNDQWAQATFTQFLTTDDHVIVTVRQANAPTETYYGCRVNDTAGVKTSSIEERTAGTSANLVTDTTTVWALGDKIRCEVQDTTIRFYRIPAGTSTDILVLTTEDASIASGKAGLRIEAATATTSPELDDFVVGGFTASQAIAVDAVSNSAAGNVTNTIPITHTVGTSSTDILLVCAYARDAVAGDTAVTSVSSSVDGAFTKIRHDEQTGTFRTELWYKLNPTAGVHTITTTWAGALASYGVASAISLTGVDQSSPIDAQGGGTGSSATPSATVTTVAANAQITACVLGQAGGLTATSGQVERVDRDTTGTVDGVALSTVDQKASPGAEVLSWSQSSAQGWTVSAASFKPASTAVIAAPRIATLTAVTATGLDLTVGSTLPTTVRVEDDRGSIVAPFMQFTPTLTQTISDDFASMASWTTNTGLEALTASGGIARATTLNTAAGSTHNTAVGADHYGQVTIPAWAGSSDQFAEITVRWDKVANSGYLCGADRTASGEHVYINKRTAGANGNVAFTTTNITAGDILRCHAIGTMIVATLNGTPMTSYTDTANTYPTGQVGLLAFVTSGSVSDFTFDTFRAGTVGAPYHHTFVGIQDGLTYKRYFARDSAGLENQLTADSPQVSLVGIVPALDTNPIVMSDPQPTNVLPAGTTSTIISVAFDKFGEARWSTTDQAYSSMPSTNVMSVVGGRASATISSLTDGIDTNRYVRGNFTNAIGTEFANTTSATVRIRVASAADVTPPFITSGPTTINLASGSTFWVLTVNTSENATCKGDLTPGTAYASMDETFAGTGTQTHTHNVTGLMDNSTTLFYVRCTDGTNPNLSDYAVTFVVTGLPPDATPPGVTVTAPFGTLAAGTTNVNVTLTTTENATCKYSSVAGRAFTHPSVATMSTTGGTSHSTNIAPLTDNSGYSYFFLCQDAAGNTSPDVNVAWSVAVAAGDITVPSTVTNLVGAGISSSQGRLTWTLATDNVLVRRYLLWISLDGVTYNFVAFVDAPTITYDVPNLLSNTLYYAVVRAEDSSGNRSAADSNVATWTTEANVDTQPPQDMTGFRGTTFTSSVFLEWNQCVDESGVSTAVIERCLLEDCSSFTQVGALTGLTFLGQGLTPGTINWFRGHCSDGVNRSLNDTPILGFTAPTIGLPQPRDTLPFGVERGAATRAEPSSVITSHSYIWRADGNSATQGSGSISNWPTLTNSTASCTLSQVTDYSTLPTRAPLSGDTSLHYIKMVCTGGASGGTIDVFPDIPNAALTNVGNFGIFWYQSELDAASITGWTMWLTSDLGFASSFQFDANTGTVGKRRTQGWNLFQWKRGDQNTTVGGEVYSNTFVYARLQLTIVAGTSFTAYFSDLIRDYVARPQIMVWSADNDTAGTEYANIFGLMNSANYNIKGSYAPTGDAMLVPTGSSMTLSQMATMRAAGWTWHGHQSNSSGLNYTTMSAADLRTEVALVKAQLGQAGVTTISPIYVYPGGNRNAATDAILAEYGFSGPHVGGNVSSDPNGLPWYGGAIYPYIWNYSCDAVSAAVCQAAISHAVNYGESLAILYHINPTAQCDAACFRSTMDMLNAMRSGGTINLTTFDGVYSPTSGVTGRAVRP